MQSLGAILHPERYHGHSKRAGFFEGWYYKLVSRDERRRFAIIPGVFLGKTSDTSHAFVQILDGISGLSHFQRYPMAAFWAADDMLDVRIGPNRFTPINLEVKLDEGPLPLAGTLHFYGNTPWPVTLLSPGIMGWYAWVPFMEAYHGVVSLDHHIEGELRMAGEVIPFSGGRGYIEKDWGQAFPSAWVWMQTNHFGGPGTSLTASIATIPWVRRAFRGFIIGFWHGRRLYRFATYTGAVTEGLEITDSHVLWMIRDNAFRLRLWAERAQGGILHEPVRSEMSPRVVETMNATVQVELWSLSNGRPARLFDGVGRCAGLEVSGDLPTLLRG